MIEALQQLSAVLEHEDALEKTLQTIVDLSVASIPGCDAAGVTLRAGGKTGTAAASDELTLELDRIQYDAEEGPCLEAADSGLTVRIDALSEESRWPEFRRRAADAALGSSLSHPLKDNGSVGALNLYAKRERSFDESSTAIAEIFARQATIALRNARTYLAARRLSEQLNDALQSRDVIGQAKGILMEREGVSADRAFEMLTTISQNANVKLRDVAQRIVDETLRAR
ncbi:MAG TPA: GAF and ANTAR domain-containing protein [Actinomycetota bacterium]|nr:GAF and ANTAR domain-containing protein [Actinomycetota bacterium]